VWYIKVNFEVGKGLFCGMYVSLLLDMTVTAVSDLEGYKSLLCGVSKSILLGRKGSLLQYVWVSFVVHIGHFCGPIGRQAMSWHTCAWVTSKNE